MTSPKPGEAQPTAGQLKVPTGRLSRFFELSRAAGGMMAAGATEKIRRLSDKASEELPHVLLTAESARLLALRLSRLRGAAMKVGQMLSLEGDSVLPPEFAKALEVLRSSAHRMPDEQVRRLLRDEYGPDHEERFAEFDFEPIAAASIGQVHRAVTIDGQELVLKIQYPGVRESIESDVDNLRSLIQLARLVPKSVNLDEFVMAIKNELRQEVDYGRELAMLETYREKVKSDSRLRLPEPYPEHSTSRILAMERLFSVPLLQWAQDATQKDRDRVGSLLFELLLAELFEYRFCQTDPNPANYQYDPAEQKLVLLDFGAARAVSTDVADVYKRAFSGLLERDETQLRGVLSDLGVDSEAAPQASSLLLSLALEAAEVFDTEEFDFGATDLQKRLNEKGREMARHQGEVEPPAPEYIFFQRKLTGTFLLCKQLRAKVRCKMLVERAITR